jgi:NADPH-dependent FMN reductase.
MSNAALIYFSLDGNVDYIAKLIARKTGADLIRLETVREYPKGIGKFITAGREATFGLRPALKNAFPDFDQFSTVIIGTPVWAGKPSSPVNTFLHNCKFSGKRIALFACCAGDATEKCFAKMKSLLEGNTIITCDTFINPLKNPGETVNRKVEMLASKI